MMTEMDDVMVLESRLPYLKDLDRSVLAARAQEMQEDVLLYKEAALQPTGHWVQVRTPAAMMTEMDDPMVLESNLAACAREKQEAVSKTGLFENSVVDLLASMEVTEQVLGTETSPPALTYSPVGHDMSKHGDGAQSESAQEQELALPRKPSEVVIACELPFEGSSFSSLDSGNVNDIAVEGTVVAEKTCRIRRKNWGQEDTDDVLGAVSNTPKVCTRMEQGTDSDSYWDAIAKAVPGRTGPECRGRMDTLKRSFSTIKKYCDGHRKEFKQLNEEDFVKMKVSPRFSEAWYNQIRDYCPPRPKKKLKTSGAESSSKSAGFVPDTSTLGLLPPIFGEPALVGRLDYGVTSNRIRVYSMPRKEPQLLLYSESYPVVRLTPSRRTLEEYQESKVAASSATSGFVMLSL